MTDSGDQDDPYTRIDHPKEITRILEHLCEPGGAWLELPETSAGALPVIVETTAIEATLRLNITAIQKYTDALGKGAPFRVAGEDRRGPVRTPPLTATRIWEQDSNILLECEFPPYLEIMQRRDTFRAKPNASMRARVTIHDENMSATGVLRDLSIHGCLAELEACSVMLLEDRNEPLTLELAFPDGTKVVTPAWPRHQDIEGDRVICGFHLELNGPEQEHQMWFLVNEIDRAAASHAGSGRSHSRRSTLFSGDALGSGELTATSHTYRTPAAREMATCASFMATQLLRLRHDQDIDSQLLSERSEQLVALHASDREQALFALACLTYEPPLVRHGLAVALRLLDLTAELKLSRSARKALTAAGMVHDLGKALLPAAVRRASSLSDDQRQLVHQQVDALQKHLAKCQWLSPQAIEVVIRGANERMDGSGYPDGRSGDDLHALARLAAVVDVADAMAHKRPDRPGLPIDRIYTHLRKSTQLFDQRCVERYISHFGTWPVGTLARFGDGRLGWIMALDADGSIATVQLATDASSPDVPDAELVSGNALTTLGSPRAAVVIDE